MEPYKQGADLLLSTKIKINEIRNNDTTGNHLKSFPISNDTTKKNYFDWGLLKRFYEYNLMNLFKSQVIYK